ncbi:MAG: hypothetical protein RAK23_04715 [Thermoplasmata archaeon]|nr:hypothetical protein [Thermoplasmata archaeon]
MTDLREDVVDDRGTIKKLQLLFPGYHGYRVNEDLRDADIYLKNEIYKRMLNDIELIKSAEQNLTMNGIFSNLDRVGILKSKMQSLAGEIKHHEAGYSGISPPIRIGKDKISALYDLDMKIYNKISDIEQLINKFFDETSTGKCDIALLNNLINSLNELKEINDSRDKLLYGGV